jgi:hypothetical protein
LTTGWSPANVREGSDMQAWAKIVTTKYLNAGSALVLMGAMWLYLWVFPWRQYYFLEPHWGHNYAEAAAFLAVGLAYYNRRFISDLLALAATGLIIPASLELLPHPPTAIAGGALLALIVADGLVERGRATDLGTSKNRRLRFWLKSHLLRFAYIMLAHLALIYYLVRLPGGTYETDLVTQVYDAMLIPFIGLALIEGPVRMLWGMATEYVAFFWGMAMTVVALIILIGQPETWICLALAAAATAVAITALVLARTGRPRHTTA